MMEVYVWIYILVQYKHNIIVLYYICNLSMIFTHIHILFDKYIYFSYKVHQVYFHIPKSFFENINST